MKAKKPTKKQRLAQEAENKEVEIDREFLTKLKELTLSLKRDVTTVLNYSETGILAELKLIRLSDETVKAARDAEASKKGKLEEEMKKLVNK